MKPFKFMSAHEKVDHVAPVGTSIKMKDLCKKTGYARTYLRSILSGMNKSGYKFMIRNDIVWREK